MRAGKPKGSVVFNKLRQTWNFLWLENGQRKSRKLGTLTELPTHADALKKAECLRRDLRLQQERAIVTVGALVERYRTERMPQRANTRRTYEVWFKHYVLPRWADASITDLQARPVELWLNSLAVSPKSRGQIRGLISVLWDYAMWRCDVPMQPNPMSLVVVKGASKRTRQPRSLTVEEFQLFIQHLGEPFRTIALLCCCLGLRISEALALRWADVDWLNSRLRIERRIICQQVDEVKTSQSKKNMVLDTDLLEVLKLWKARTQLPQPQDWLFASPTQIGRLPWSYDQVWRSYQRAAEKAGIGGLSTHSLRHTYRTWLDSVGTPVGVQQKLMRHADTRTTMNIYGDAVTDDMRMAQEKVSKLAMPKPKVIS